MNFSFDLSGDPNFITNFEKKQMHALGVFIKLPKDFLKLVKDKSIKVHRFENLINDKSHKWLNSLLGAPYYGPINHLDQKYISQDIEEAWVLAGTSKFIDKLNQARKWEINRGIVNGKFLYDLEHPYLGDEYLLPWKNVIPGFLRSRELGWIGWANVSTDAEKKPGVNTKFLITWNHHRIDNCQKKLEEKIKKFFTITGASFRWLWGRSSIDDEWEQFLREYDVYVTSRMTK